jgi:hypothetical protein
LHAELTNGNFSGKRSACLRRIVEAKWASEFGVAQDSVREAINILVFLASESTEMTDGKPVG